MVSHAGQNELVRRFVLSSVVLLCAGAPAVAARAAWSPVEHMRDASNPRSVALAGDARGDAAVAWIVNHPDRHAVTAVRVAIRRGRSGVWSAHLLRSARDLAAGGIALAMAPSGEVTVAWIEQPNGGHRTVRAAYRTPTGRWSTVQAVGYAAPFAFAYPRLAVAAEGTVALVYNAGVRAAPGMAAAWRRPGRPFGRIAAVPGGRLSEPTLAFDAAGTAFLVGTALCDNEEQSQGVVQTALASSHRFGVRRTITPHPATELRFVLTGVGRGLASWIDAGCSTTELLGGSVSARRVGLSDAGPVAAVAPAYENDLRMVAAPGGADLTWTGYAGDPAGVLFLAHVSTDGTGERPHLPADGWMPIGADAAGDQVLQTAVVQNGGEPRAIAARAAASTTVDLSPLAGPAYWIAAGSATGRTLIVATTLVGALRVATWTP